MSAWQRLLRHPESLWLRRCFFRLHVWLGVGAGVYVLLMSVTGSVIVFRNQLETRASLVPSVEWVVDLHENLLSGDAGRFANGIGSIVATLLCLTGAVIWWPGVSDWRRSLTVNWRMHVARVNWDLHSALGFWSFLFVLMWGISGFYFCFPKVVNALFGFLDPGDKFTDATLKWLSLFHFGRFGLLSEALWTLLGLVPAVLAITGIFLCCHRMIYKGAPSGAAKPGRSGELN